MKIFNTMTRQKEEFVPLTPGEYRIYVCGPTVYNFVHIGNARPMIVFDTLRRYLEYRGNKVIFVSNITDIDDKLIQKGKEEGVSMLEVARKFEAEYISSCTYTLSPRELIIALRLTASVRIRIGEIMAMKPLGTHSIACRKVMTLRVTR